MVIGHIIAFITITWMQRSILVKVLSKHDIDVTVQRRIEAHAAKIESSKQSNEEPPTRTDENEDVWQEDEDVQWSGEVGNSIGEDVEWTEVIEMDD